MNKVALRGFGLAAMLGAVAMATAQEAFKFDYLGVEVGAFMPTSGVLRNKFGSSVTRIGISPIMNRRTPDWRLSYEFGYIGAKDSNEHFTIIPLTVGMQKSFGEIDEPFATYVRGGIGLAYMDFDINASDKTRIVPATAIEVGLIGGDRFKLSARWYLFAKQENIDFSGLLISASYGLFKM